MTYSTYSDVFSRTREGGRSSLSANFRLSSWRRSINKNKSPGILRVWGGDAIITLKWAVLGCSVPAYSPRTVIVLSAKGAGIRGFFDTVSPVFLDQSHHRGYCADRFHIAPGQVRDWAASLAELELFSRHDVGLIFCSHASRLSSQCFSWCCVCSRLLYRQVDSTYQLLLATSDWLAGCRLSIGSVLEDGVNGCCCSLEAAGGGT